MGRLGSRWTGLSRAAWRLAGPWPVRSASHRPLPGALLGLRGVPAPPGYAACGLSAPTLRSARAAAAESGDWQVPG